MALISSSNLILSLLLFHLTLSAYLLFSPMTLIDQTLVLVLGAAMNLPAPSSTAFGYLKGANRARKLDSSMDSQSAAAGLAGLVLLLLTISDFVAWNYDFGFGGPASGDNEEDKDTGVKVAKRAVDNAESRSDAENMSELKRCLYWTNQALFRLAFFLLVTGWAYGATKLELGSRGVRPGLFSGLAVESVCNSIAFTWVFMEMMAWFWVYQTVREEKRAVLARVAQKRQ